MYTLCRKCTTSSNLTSQLHTVIIIKTIVLSFEGSSTNLGRNPPKLVMEYIHILCYAVQQFLGGAKSRKHLTKSQRGFRCRQ